MAYFADLTPYTFIRGLANQRVLNVGWLSHGHKFLEGTVPEEVLAKISVLCKRPC
jgi:hypothetical protein